MDLASAKMIGAGLACIALVGAGIGIGNVFSALISSVARNPAALEISGNGSPDRTASPVRTVPSATQVSART